MLPILSLVLLLLASVDVAPAQAQSRARPGTTTTLCRTPEPLTLLALGVRQILREHALDTDWPVYQVPCDSLPAIVDASPRAIVIVDRSTASEQDVLQYGLAPFPFGPAGTVEVQPRDPFARLGRLVTTPALTAVPSVWIRGSVAPAQADVLRLALAAGAVQAIAGFRQPLCDSPDAAVVDGLLAAASENARNHPDYLLYFQAARLEYQFASGQAVELAPAADAVARDLAGFAVQGLRCDVGNRDRFSLSPFGSGSTSLARAAEHLRSAVEGARRNGRSDLGQVNLARACTLDAIRDMLQRQRSPSCRADDYGLWTRTYAPLLQAAQVKALGGRR